MTYKSFSRNVSNILERKSNASLSLLLEEEEGEISFGDESLDNDSADAEGGGSDTDEPSTDESSTDEPSTDEPSTDESSTDAPSTDAGGGGGDNAEGGVSKEQLSLDVTNMHDTFKNMMSFYDKFGQGTEDGSTPLGLHAIQDFISSHVSNAVKESNMRKEKSSYSLDSKNSISYFLNEEVSIEDVEKDIDAVNNIIDKGSELIDKFKKGTELNIERYVDAAINAFKNFDSLFSKESIIKQAVINLIVLNSGAKAEQNIKDFEELFHEELHKQFGIEYEEHALITKSHNVAVGAVKQG